MTDHCGSCQSKNGDDTDSKCMALNLAFLNYKEKKCGTIRIKGGTVSLRKSIKLVHGILLFGVSNNTVRSRDTRKPSVLNDFCQTLPKAVLGGGKI